jgi:IS5 family transposase
MYQASLMTDGFIKQPKRTRKAVFLERMNGLLPWNKMCELIASHYPKAGNGRPPRGLERMLRMYLVSQWFNLSDAACEEALYEIMSFRQFCGFDLGNETIPDATTLENFRHLLERHALGKSLFCLIGDLLDKQGLRYSGGTIVDASIIDAPTSTKNQHKQRDTEMHATKKGNQWYFGMKLHIGVNSTTGIIHSAGVSAANMHDSQMLPALMHGRETRLYGDGAYTGQKAVMKKCAPKAQDFTQARPWRNKPLTQAQLAKNKTKSRVRAKVEHPFLWIKRIWGFDKVRYRGLAKNLNRALMLLLSYNVMKANVQLTG